MKVKTEKCARYCFYFTFFILNFVLYSSSYSDEYQDAWGYFLNGRYNSSEKIVNYLLQEKNNSPGIYYLKALVLLKKARFEKARTYFDKLYFYGGKWSQYSTIGKADTFFLSANFKNASLLYETFLRRYPQSDFTPQVLYKYALSLRKEGRWDEAKHNLKEIVQEYPLSIPSTYARRILAENEFYFTIQVGSFLNYDNAYNLKNKVASLGYSAYIKSSENRGKLYYRVRVGKFESRPEMEEAFKKLLSQGYSGLIYP